MSGSDANNGLTAATAWRTVNKALSATGIASGDTLYIGAGKYREIVSLGLTSPTVETSIIGDVHGIYTGDAGEVIISAQTSGDYLVAAASTVMTLGGRDFLTFKNIYFMGGSAAPSVINAAATSTDIKFQKCTFATTTGTNRTAIAITVGFEVVANWEIDSCVIFSNTLQSSVGAVDVTLTTGTGTDWDAKIVIKNCLFHANGGSVLRVTSSGVAANEGGGVVMRNCTIIGGATAISTTTTRVGGSTFTYPVIVENCVITHSNSNIVFTGGELGALVENYNIVYGGSSIRSNVNIGPQTRVSLEGYLEIGNRDLMNDYSRSMFSPSENSLLCSFGNKTTSAPLDILGIKTDAGSNVVLHDGNVTSSTDNSITDTLASFGTSGHLYHKVIKIASGVGAGQTKTIRAHSNISITGDGQWITNPDATSRYLVYTSPLSLTSKATAGTSITVTDSYAVWPNNLWAGFTCNLITGNTSFVVSGNSATILSGYSDLSYTPISGDSYHLYWGSGSSASGVDYIHNAPGCFARDNTATKSTGIYHTSPTAIRLSGPAMQDFYIPVDATSTTVAVQSYYDLLYSGTRPQIMIRNGEYIGVSEATGTNAAAANTWDNISLNFTPSGKGVVTVRLQSNATGAGGSAYFDNLITS